MPTLEPHASALFAAALDITPPPNNWAPCAASRCACWRQPSLQLPHHHALPTTRHAIQRHIHNATGGSGSLATVASCQGGTWRAARLPSLASIRSISGALQFRMEVGAPCSLAAPCSVAAGPLSLLPLWHAAVYSGHDDWPVDRAERLFQSQLACHRAQQHCSTGPWSRSTLCNPGQCVRVCGGQSGIILPLIRCVEVRLIDRCAGGPNACTEPGCNETSGLAVADRRTLVVVVATTAQSDDEP